MKTKTYYEVCLEEKLKTLYNARLQMRSAFNDAQMRHECELAESFLTAWKGIEHGILKIRRALLNTPYENVAFQLYIEYELNPNDFIEVGA